MLKQLTIKNYILIDAIDLHFDQGFTAITGETGSGKSILMGALGIVLGDRFDKKAIRDASKKCVVEAKFILNTSDRAFLIKNDLDDEPETILRREISPSGKSRAFINDTPVTLNLIREFSLRLVDIHAQHEHTALFNKDTQFDALDAFAGHEDLNASYQQAYAQFAENLNLLNDLVEREKNISADLDYFRFQLGELEDAKLDTIDQESIETELLSLENADEIQHVLSEVSYQIDGEEQSIAEKLSQMTRSSEKISSHAPELLEIHERLKSITIEIKDLSDTLSSKAERWSPNPEKLEELRSLMDDIHRLQSKHRVNTIAELLLLKQSIAERIEGADSIEDQIKTQQAHLIVLEESLKDAGNALSASRGKVVPLLCATVEKSFREIGLEHAKFEIALEPGNPNRRGMDKIEFRFSANKGQALAPIQQAASGGEISRVMLGLKAAISEMKSLPTLILDEIDTGISGEVAKKVGFVMRKMGDNTQLLAITHLPQVAGKAQHHFKVLKSHDGDASTTQILRLSERERVEEISAMIMGTSGTSEIEKEVEKLAKEMIR